MPTPGGNISVSPMSGDNVTTGTFVFCQIVPRSRVILSAEDPAPGFTGWWVPGPKSHCDEEELTLLSGYCSLGSPSLGV